MIDKLIPGFLLICLIMSMPIFSFGADQRQITWIDCVREAFRNNPDLISSREVIKQREADMKTARSGMLPQISAQASGKKYKSGGMNEDAESYAYSINGEQLLYDGFSTYHEYRASKENMTASQYQSAVMSSNIRLNLRVAFTKLLKAQRMVSLTKGIAERKQQNLELVYLRYEAGREHKGALLMARAELASADFELIQARRDLLLAQTRLKKSMGWDTKASVTVIGEFNVKNLESIQPDFSYLADNTPLLKEFGARKQAAGYSLASAKDNFLPRIYFNASAGKNDSEWPPDESEWRAGVDMSLSLFEGGKKFSKVAKAKARLSQAEADEQSGRNGIILTLEKTWVNLQDAVGMIGVRRKFLEAAEERAKIANAQYSTGMISFDDWIIIENNLADAKKAYLNAQAEMLIANANWFQAKGWTLNDEKNN